MYDVVEYDPQKEFRAPEFLRTLIVGRLIMHDQDIGPDFKIL